MHTWGDKDFDWEGLGKAEQDLYFICTRLGRIGGQIKEKYGTLRFYANFDDLSLHTLLWPGYVYLRIPHGMNRGSELLCKYTGLSYLFTLYQKLMYKLGYRYILAKYPHLRLEIGAVADYPELFAHKIVITKDAEGTLSEYFYKDGTLLAAWRSL